MKRHRLIDKKEWAENVTARALYIKGVAAPGGQASQQFNRAHALACAENCNIAAPTASRRHKAGALRLRQMQIMTTQPHILVVDDEPDLREILQCNLEAAGYAVDTAASAEEALALLAPHHSLILLDVMLGGMSGFQMAEHLRKVVHNQVPILFLTAKDQENDLLTGFASGGDDYMAKPFSVHEVLARIKAILRRTHTAEQPAQWQAGGMTIDNERKTVSAGGKDICLSRKEFGILALLSAHPAKVFTRQEILDAVWQGESFVLDRTVDVHIARLRRKLGAHGAHLINRPGHGYCFSEDA